MKVSSEPSDMTVKEKEVRSFSGERKKVSATMPDGEWINVKVTRRSYVLLFSLCLMPLLLAGGFLLGRVNWAKEWNSLRPGHTAIPAQKSFQLNPGPWGTMEYIPFFLEIPEEFLAVRQDQQSERRWFFKNFSREKVNEFFGGVGLSAGEKKQLIESGKFEAATNGVYVAAPSDVIFSMSPQSRAQIYSTLAQFPENTWQREDLFSYPADSIDEFFASSPLPAETIALVKKLCWPRGKLLMFCDLPAVLDTLPTAKEKLRLEKTLSRRPTMLLKLRVGQNSDVNGLVSYWGRAGLQKDLKPLLEGLSKLPQGSLVDVTHLLPPMPTARIYTYPFPSYNQPENCHWTSFNFFRDPQDARYTDISFIQQKLATDYYPVFSDPRYGDVVFLTKPSGDIIHSAVYVADNIVYTKNGGHFSAPWLLMQLPNLINTYSTFVGPNEEIKISYYRNKYY